MSADITSFVEELEDKIDLLVNIDNKVDFTSEYDTGYKDAAVAIKNTVRTIAKKFDKG